jgi:tetrathionate reductase subunit B
MKRYALFIDDRSCWGCKTCEVACQQEFDFSDGANLLWVVEEKTRVINGGLRFAFQVNVCRHCDDPPCVGACPEGAIAKREDGIVVLEGEKCNGCEACIELCPFDAIAFDAETNQAKKCNLCHHRVDKGLLPACADNVCLAHCIHFGDENSVRLAREKTGLPER